MCSARTNLRVLLSTFIVMNGWLFALAQPAEEATSASLRLRMSRQAPVWWETAQQQLRQGQTAAALSLLSQLQREAADQFVPLGEAALTTDQLLEQLVERLPATDRKAWEATVAPQAMALWQRWQSERDFAALRQLCRSYRLTALGLEGWRTLAAVLRDQRQFRHALMAYEVLLRHPHATRSDKAAALLAQARLSQLLADHEQLDALEKQWKQYASELSSESVRLAGETVPLAEWFVNFARQSTQSKKPADGSASAIWRYPWDWPEGLFPLWKSVEQEYRASGVWLLPAVEPLCTADWLIYRSLTHIVARDLHTGDVRWRTPPQQEYEWLRTNPGLLDNRSFRSLFIEQLYRRCLADSIWGRLTADARAVYAVHDPRGLGSGSTGGQPPNWPPRQNVGAGEVRHNRLTAYRLEDGTLLWQVGGTSSGSTYPLSGVFFCGPPLPLDDQLYVLAQQGNELSLLTLLADRGELVSSILLGDTPRPLSEDPLRQRVACPVTRMDDLLLCPTAAGAVVAVDPLTQAPRWAYRYPVELRLRSDAERGPSSVTARDAWWDGWRDVQICRSGGVVVFVSPETNRLHALDRTTGKLLWSVARGQGLLLVGIQAHAVIVAEPTALRAHRLNTGELLWRTPVGELSGRPVIAGETLFVPTETHGLLVFRGTDEELVPIQLADPRSVGNIVHHEGQWWSLSVTSVESLGQLTNPPAGTPDNRENQRRWFFHQLATQPQSWPEWSARIQELAETPAERIAMELAVVQAAQVTGESITAARRLLDLSQHVSREEFLRHHLPRRLIRADLSVVAAWDDLERSTAPSDRLLVQELLQRSWDSACHSIDPFAVQRWRDFWQDSRFAQRLSVLTHPKVFLGQPLAAVEGTLLTSSDPLQRPLLLWQLTEELARAGFQDDAAAYRERLVRHHAGALLPDGRTIATALRQVPSPPRKRDPWPVRDPEVEVLPGSILDNVHHVAVPLDPESTPLFEHLDVTVDRLGRRLRFCDARQRGVWELTLPSSTSPWRHAPELVAGWGRGRILIVRVGLELFALSPFDERGEPKASLLWTQDLGGAIAPEHLAIQFTTAITGIREEGLRLIDAFGHSVGQVGPVRPMYLCYRQNARLISVETLTGRKRWERYDLPVDAVITGDDQFIIVWSPSHQLLEILRAVDAAPLEQRPWTITPDELVLLRDRRAWHWQRGQTSRLICYDLVSGKVLWSREVPVGGIPFALDGETLGLTDPQGVLHLCDTDDGAPLGEALTLELPQTIERIVVSRDSERWYVGFSERHAQQAALRLNQLRQGYRVPIMNGPLYAIDQKTVSLTWGISLDREGWPVDQPRALPLLYQAYKPLPSGTPQQAVPTILRLRDKRTGKDLLFRDDLRSVPYVAFTGDPDQGLLDVLLEREAFRLRYYPAPPPPPLPE